LQRLAVGEERVVTWRRSRCDSGARFHSNFLDVRGLGSALLGYWGLEYVSLLWQLEFELFFDRRQLCLPQIELKFGHRGFFELQSFSQLLGGGLYSTCQRRGVDTLGGLLA